jgi:hypothetical protein
MPTFKKLFGENPETIAVLATTVNFDENGIADVSDEVAEVLSEIPGYEPAELVEKVDAPSEDHEEEAPAEEPADEEHEEEEPASEEDDEEEAEEDEKPKKPAPRARKSPAKR